MIRFDKLKIITNIKYISNINDKAFATQTINGCRKRSISTHSERLNPSSFTAKLALKSA